MNAINGFFEEKVLIDTFENNIQIGRKDKKIEYNNKYNLEYDILHK